jgi:hypothetical protein
LRLSLLRTHHIFIVQQVRETFDYVACLDHTVAVGLLKAVMPLVMGSTALRDALVLVLRKALFNRDVNARKVSKLVTIFFTSLTLQFSSLFRSL